VLAAVGKLGLRQLGDQVLVLAQAARNEPALREQAIGVIVQLRLDGAAQALRGLLADSQGAVREAALWALVDLQDVKTLKEVLLTDKFPPRVRESAADRLMQSTGGALVLLRLIDAGQLPDVVRRAVIAKAADHPDSNVRVLYEKFIPEAQRPKKLGESIKPEQILALQGDAQRGEKIFNQSSAAQCKSCHALQGNGGTLGPDLTTIGKKYERKSLLETILEPSKAIAPEYIPYLLETSGGQVYGGFLVEKTDEHVLLKDVKSQLIRIPAGEVEALAAQTKSLMPELVLRDVTAQDAADLLAFLMTLNQGVSQE
jgi:putative heme-binding domain-containing protein